MIIDDKLVGRAVAAGRRILVQELKKKKNWKIREKCGPNCPNGHLSLK